MERTLFAEYKQKLNVEDKTIPDPIDLKIGWIGEENGMEQWSRLYFSDISRYYGSALGKNDLISRLECEYKQGKAYSYLTNISSLGKFYFILSQMNRSFVF